MTPSAIYSQKMFLNAILASCYSDASTKEFLVMNASELLEVALIVVNLSKGSDISFIFVAYS